MMQDFEYRKPYGHKPVHFKKKFVITRTTNEVRHLKDRSGDRRFLSIYAHPEKQTKNPVSELTPEVVQQLWGEAVWLYKNAKDPFRFTPKQEALLKANREEFRYTSGLEDNLMDVLENKFKDQDLFQTEIYLLRYSKITMLYQEIISKPEKFAITWNTKDMLLGQVS